MRGAERALRASPSTVHEGRLEMPRMELECDGRTYTYKLQRLHSGGSNAVFAVRVAKLDDRMVDVEAERMVAYARSRASGGEAASLSNESVAVLVHDVLAAKYDELLAIDVAGAVYESGLFSGRRMHELAQTYDIELELVKCGMCGKEVASYVDQKLSPMFEDESTHVEVAGNTDHLESNSACEWIEDLLVRMQIKSVHRGDEEPYWREVAQSERLSDAGLAPRTHARLLLVRGERVLPCVVLERFEYSLAEVQKCPALIRRMFVESDGESALVDLYARTSRLMRCIDTKPGNVVVRLPKPVSEVARVIRERRGKLSREELGALRERMRPRLALIDVDPKYCGEPRSAALSGRAAWRTCTML